MSYSPRKFSFFSKSRLIFNILLFLYVCNQTFCKLYWYITRKFLGLRTQNFQGIIFIWTQTSVFCIISNLYQSPIFEGKLQVFYQLSEWNENSQYVLLLFLVLVLFYSLFMSFFILEIFKFMYDKSFVRHCFHFQFWMIWTAVYKTFKYMQKQMWKIGIQRKIIKICCSHCELHFKKRKTYKLTGGFLIFCYNMLLHNRGHFS